MATSYSSRPQVQSHRRLQGFDFPTSNQPFRPPQPPQPPQQRAPPPPPKNDVPPPLLRQNSKTTPPSPPRIIRDSIKSTTYTRIGFLGEGGFARVYEVADIRGNRHAIKVVTKSSLKTKKSKTKLYAEIKLHKELSHPNIVLFENCFEDTENVYMTLELCPNGSMMDMLRQRKRFTEPEARFYLVQILGACHYMHTHQVIHRDLKLGNLFLDANMNIKVGDFGLAALIETPGERKKTICGTPNYIAPEVLFDTANGHSFEVDTWSIGVILYTLVVGKPPFQTKDVKAIYQRIRDNNYEFPGDRELSDEVQELVASILTHNPLERPTLLEIVEHAFFTRGLVPSSIPRSALEYSPSFPELDRSASRRNLARLRKQTMLDEDLDNLSMLSSSMASMAVGTKNYANTAAEQERDFQKAVQPASPISALLRSARQPLIVAQLNVGGASGASSNTNNNGSLFRKLSAVAPQGSAAAPLGNGNANVDPPARMGPLTTLVEQDEDEVAAKSERNRTRELESQKARIVAQMVPDGEGRNAHMPPSSDDGSGDEMENVPPPVPQRSRDRMRDEERERARERERDTEKRQVERERRSAPAPSRPASRAAAVDMAQPPRTSSSAHIATASTAAAVPTSSSAPPSSGLQLHGFDQLAELLTHAFDMKEQGRLFRNPAEDVDLNYEKVFIVSWVDYCNKYGMGYALSDGTVGVHFNDSTTLLLAPNKKNLDYLSSRRGGAVFVRKHYHQDDHPEDVQNKLYLLKHFEAYMLDRLYGEHPFCFEDVERTKGMDFVQKYFRMKNVIVFRLSHEVIQFNFYDHTKVILSDKGHAVTYLDKHYRVTNTSLANIMHRALHPSADTSQRKSDERLVAKIKYCKEVMASIRTAGMSETDS